MFLLTASKHSTFGPTSGVVSSRVRSLPGCPFGCAADVCSWAELWCRLKPSRGPLGPGSRGDQCWRLPVTGPGLPVWSCHAIGCSRLPPQGPAVLGRLSSSVIFTQIFVFLSGLIILLKHKSPLHILGTSPMRECFANIFSCSPACHFIFLMVSLNC